MKTIHTVWEEYWAITAPAGAGEAQKHDTHMAFLAGADALKTLLQTHSEAEGLHILTHLQGQVAAAVAANRIRELGTGT